MRSGHRVASAIADDAENRGLCVGFMLIRRAQQLAEANRLFARGSFQERRLGDSRVFSASNEQVGRGVEVAVRANEMRR